ncbi:hypothetical protein [Crocosphaera sp. Alani8]|uniref:hypothetical protein n=2 Tax=unclassified Crocosphaera TaxID=2623705 RepID=UPI00313F2B6F
MTVDEGLLSSIEKLRTPLNNANAPIDWKDWYHYILIDIQTEIRVLVNISLIGRIEKGEIQTTFIVTIPSDNLQEKLSPSVPILTFGIAFSQEWTIDNVQRNPLQIQGKQISLNIVNKDCSLTVNDSRSQLGINFRGQAKATPLLVTENSPFGSGFIGWGFVPGLQVNGELSICNQTFDINENWCCYHDRNFGRFRWGEDIGWEWLVAFLRDENGQKFTIVLDKRTNKDHFISGLAYIFIYQENEPMKTFVGENLQINWQWTNSPVTPLRLPGIMASLFNERSLKMPRSLEIRATDSQDNLTLNIQFETATELIVPDNQARQYSFIEEVTGSTEMTLFSGNQFIKATGITYAEYVI